MTKIHKGAADLSVEKKRALLAQLLQNKANNTNRFPLSFAQQRLWFLDQLEPNNPTYNIPEGFRLSGRLNSSVLEKSLSEILRRHDVLRTRFKAVDGKPAQVIVPEITVPLNRVDLQHFAEGDREAEMWRLIKEEVQCPFDLAKGPLLRTALFRLAEEEHVLLLTMHHIISDGWSVGVLIRELCLLYQAFANGHSSLSGVLPDLPVQYADFAVRQREWLHGDELEKQLSYWRKQLVDASSILELPTDYPRKALQTFQGARQSIELSRELTQSLRKLSLDKGGTLFMTLLAAFNILLWRYTGQNDLNVGTPIAGRDSDDVENLIGCFVNTIVLRTKMNDSVGFLELLAQVREVALGAYDHQVVPFERLLEDLQPQRDLSRSPLYQVMFSLQNAASKSVVELPGLTLEHLDVHNGMAKFDLTIYMWEEASGIGGVFEYNTALFDAHTITRLRDHYTMILEGIAANPEQRLSEICLLTDAERHRLVIDWNATEKKYPSEKSFHELFESQVKRNPQAVSVVMEGEEFTYHELNVRANELGHHLRKLGVGPDVLVGICVERSLEMLVGLLGIMKAGGAYVPLDPSYPKERLSYMVEDSGLSILLSQKQVFAELLEDRKPGIEDSHSPFSILHSQNRVICLDSNWQEIAKESESNPESQTRASNLAYVIHTSGSTGKPKGVAIQHQTLINFLMSMSQEPGLTQDDALLAVTTLSFDIAGLELYLPLLVGARVILASREVASDARLLSGLLTDSGATIMQATPATWRLLVDSGWSGNDKLRILCGGEALPRDLANQLLEKGAGLWNMYGPTETTIWSSVYQLESKEELVPVGAPIANTQMYILDQNLQPVPVGVYGEVYIGGDGLARGYLNRPELTAEKFMPHPFSRDGGARMYRTGDLARYLTNGNFEFQGRIDHQVKIRGFRIELGEIEATLAQHPGIDEVVVVAREDENTTQQTEKYLAAYVISKTSKAPTVSELRRYLLEPLPGYMVPTSFVYLDAFPLTPNGKVDRKALPAPDGIRPELESVFVAPQNEIERSISGVWQEVLGVEKVGVDDNFFDLGGHSLLLVQVQSKLKKIFDRDVSIIELFKYPTINTLAKSFSAEKNDSVDFLKIHDLAKKQKDALTRQKKLKEVKKDDGRLEYA